ncbi:MAG: PP2C family protein-serine/threonine phosphatase [Acidobacteria bacterium]|nr:PP2C family protein-serine/threonine phosphatase [Acidobacteriota bacterium]
MTSTANAAIAMAPPVAAPRPDAALEAPGHHFLLGWTAAWLGVGVTVAAGISFVTDIAFLPALRLSVLFAEVVGFSAYISARMVSPLLARLPGALRLTLDSLLVLGGTVFGSVAVLLTEPFFALAQFRIVFLIIALNALLAVVVAIALGTYDRMRRQIEASYRVLRERDTLEREMNVAREVQRELLPRTTPSFEMLEVAGVCQPAVAVGGDYYDFLQHSDGRPGLVIADVSGKGAPAALLMASLQASVRSLFPIAMDPGLLNERLNDALCRSSSVARYATAFLADFDPGTRRMTYSNAGHLPGLVIRGAETIRCEEGGLPIGLFEGVKYETGSLTLAPGDLLALFTDGVSEAPAPDGEEFGAERLADLLRGHFESPLDTTLQAVLDALLDWSGPVDPHDDVTLVLARVR